MDKQLTFADVMDSLNIPIGPGDYVYHSSRPGILLLVISSPFKSKIGNICIKVKDPTQHILQVLLDNVSRI